MGQLCVAAGEKRVAKEVQRCKEAVRRSECGLPVCGYDTAKKASKMTMVQETVCWPFTVGLSVWRLSSRIGVIDGVKWSFIPHAKKYLCNNSRARVASE